MNRQKIKDKIKKGKLYNNILLWYRKILKLHRLHGKYVFDNRSQDRESLCIILAGYKEYLYPAVFGRIRSFAKKDMDICVLTSGIYSKKIDELCRENNWSYLRTRSNNVSLIQNIAINLHKKAKMIFKLDEDIFITENYFNNMLLAYQHAQQGDYDPGVMAPLIPLNGYGNVRILRKLNLVDIFTKKFGTPKHRRTDDSPIEVDSQIAKFFWGEGGIVPPIDEINARFSCEPREEKICGIQFSIGAILFSHEYWEMINYFPVSRIRNLGMDERYLCQVCCTSSRPLMVSENVVVGHLGFKEQNQVMKEYYLSHKDLFITHGA